MLPRKENNCESFGVRSPEFKFDFFRESFEFLLNFSEFLNLQFFEFLIELLVLLVIFFFKFRMNVGVRFFGQLFPPRLLPC